MTPIMVADRVEVLVLVDNVTDNLSLVPDYVENELPRLARRGMRRISGRCLCCAAHGLSCAITAWRNGQSRTLLFDTGPAETVFGDNVERLGFELGSVEAMVLSHGHWDHAGAMLRALEMITLRNGGRAVPTYTHPGMYHQRAFKTPDGTMRPMDDVPSAEQLRRQGATVIETTQPQLVLDDVFFVSGEIPRVTPFETGLPGQHRLADDGVTWEPDPWLVDERFVAVRVEGKGLVVFTACSHAGVVNVLTHARECFPGTPIHAVMGGFHLSGTNERVILDIVDALRPFQLRTIAAAHCTGWRAVSRWRSRSAMRSCRRRSASSSGSDRAGQPWPGRSCSMTAMSSKAEVKRPLIAAEVPAEVWYAGIDREIRGRALRRRRQGQGRCRPDGAPPGSNTKPGHWHSHEEEHLYALSGSVILHLGAEQHVLRAGSYVCFPAAQPVSHHLDNTGGEPFVYLIGGERIAEDKVTYPDAAP